jgi:hypothetical protein
MLPEVPQTPARRAETLLPRAEDGFDADAKGSALAAPTLIPDARLAERTPLREAASDVPVALAEAMAEGIRVHVPDAVGTTAKGAPALAAACFSHFVLGLPTWVTGGFLVTGAGSAWAWALLRRRASAR